MINQLLAIWRPIRVSIRYGVVGYLLNITTIRIHEVYFPIAIAIRCKSYFISKR